MKKIFSLSIVLFIAIQGLYAQKALISVDELSKIIKNDNVVVVDTRKVKDYKKTHIKGAINLCFTEFETATPYKGKLKSAAAIAKILGSKGISNKSKVVLYCKSGINASRVYWILKYLGHKDVTLLDGQLAAWFAKRKPVNKTTPKVTAKTYTPSISKKGYADKAYVKSKLGNAKVVLLDLRKKEDFDKGSIKGAINIPYTSFQNKNKFKSTAAIKAMLQKAGVSSDKEIIVFCKTGTVASLGYFILKEVLHYPKVKLYDGSYSEWSL